MENKRINWIKIGIEVLAVFVFILLLVWLFPFGSKKNNNGSDFGDNFDSFRESARSYYTTKNLPEDSEKLTLQQLIDKKVVKKLYDKTGKACDTEKSYTRITKISDNEYQLRVDLTCGNESDYVLETLKFETKDDNKNTADNNNTNNNNNNTNNNNNKNSYNSNTIAKTKLTQYRYYKKEIEKVTTYKCENGYILDGKTCVKAADNKVQSTNKYSEEKTLTMEATKVTGGTKTTYAEVIITNGNPQYFCEKGTIGADNKCHVTDTTYINAESRLSSCGSYQESGSVCIEHYRRDVGATTSEKVYGEYTYTGSIDVTSQKNSTDTTKYVPKGQYVANACTKPGCINVEVHYKYDVYTRSVTNKETCPSGGNPSGGRCYVDDTRTHNRTTEYYCKDGSTPVNKQCPVPVDKPFDPKVTYTKNYECPKGYDSKGSGASMVCYKNTTADDTFYCSDSSYTLDKAKNICYKKVPKELIGHDCPVGYTLNTADNMCYGSKERIPAKKWTVCTIITSYTWNSKTVLEGWTRTEETRVIEF